jgi:hypothetical protein
MIIQDNHQGASVNPIIFIDSLIFVSFSDEILLMSLDTGTKEVMNIKNPNTPENP